ncbi:hypothetical protein ACM0K4_02040 [Mycoplasma sp. VS42A]
MNKFKTLLLTLAGASLIATPLVAAQCNDKKLTIKMMLIQRV